jgi:multidrug efflux system membrane fusion protein
MRHWRLAVVVVVITAAATVYLTANRGPWWSRPSTPRQTAAAIPVLASAVKRADVPIFLSGLGTVQAFNSVLVKSRVDGQILNINFTEGQDVHAGDVLAEVDPVPFQAALSQAQANRLRNEAQLGNARLDFERASRLAASGSGSKQQLDTTRAQVAQLEAAVQADGAMIDMAQNQLNYSRIRSPIDGRAGTRLVDAGNVVRSTDNAGIVTINQLHPIFVNFALPADSLPRVRAKAKDEEVKVIAQDNNEKELATGKLTVIDNQVNPATGSITYKATFSNENEVLWPGQFVNVRVEVEIRRDSITAPANAVQQGPEGAYAFVVLDNRRVQKRNVKVGFMNKAIAIIDDGLEPGDVVVTDGQYRIQAGSTVEVRSVVADSPR